MSREPAHPESSVLTTAEQGSAGETIAFRREEVDKATKRRPVAEREADHVEWYPGDRAYQSFPDGSSDSLAHADERRQQPSGSLDLPQAVQVRAVVTTTRAGAIRDRLCGIAQLAA